MKCFALCYFIFFVNLQFEFILGSEQSNAFFISQLSKSRQIPFKFTSNYLKQRPRRTFLNNILDCVFVATEESRYVYKATGNSDETCGIYLFADADNVIEIFFEYFNVSCENGGLVSFLDGWELNGEYFPGMFDHEKTFKKRYVEFCGNIKPEKTLLTSQNAGMLHYKVPHKENGFSFIMKIAKNLTPCNILVDDKRGVYTLRNYEKTNVCTLIAVFPAKVSILELRVGISGSKTLRDEESESTRKCKEGFSEDILRIGGSRGLDPSELNTFEDICGENSTSGIDDIVVACDVTVVRLISSGHFENFATLAVEQAEENHLLKSSLTCNM